MRKRLKFSRMDMSPSVKVPEPLSHDALETSKRLMNHLEEIYRDSNITPFKRLVIEKDIEIFKELLDATK